MILKVKPAVILLKNRTAISHSFFIAILITLTLLVACAKVESKAAEVNPQATVAENYPLFTSTPIGSAIFAKLPKDVLIRSGEIAITKQELDDEISKARDNIRSQLQDNAFFILEQKFTEKVLIKEGRQALSQNGKDVSNLSDMEVIQNFIGDMVEDISPTEKEMTDFYAANKDLMGGMPYEQVKGQIEMFLKQQKQQDFVQEYITGLLTNRKVEISDSWGVENIVKSMNNNVDQARISGKPTLANFGSDSCVPCQMMIPAREAIKEIFGERANVVYIHTDREQILSSRYGIQSIPTIIFFDIQGMEVHRHVGIMSQEEMEEWLNGMLTN